MKGTYHCPGEYNWQDAVRLESSDEGFAGCSKVRSDAVLQSCSLAVLPSSGPAFDGEITKSQ